jgi:hypothetical protein
MAASLLSASSPSPASITRMPWRAQASAIRSRTTGESSTTSTVLPKPVRGAAPCRLRRALAGPPGWPHQLGGLEHQRQRAVLQVHGRAHQRWRSKNLPVA